jgi:hypothetical protein
MHSPGKDAVHTKHSAYTVPTTSEAMFANKQIAPMEDTPVEVFGPNEDLKGAVPPPPNENKHGDETMHTCTCLRGNPCNILDLYEGALYGFTKIVPFLGYLPCMQRCRGRERRMRVLIEEAHIGVPVTYESATGLINTVLLIAALFLAFVAASSTIISEADYMAADLSACKLRYAHTETCIQLDLNGYFTSSNATGLLENATKYDRHINGPIDLGKLRFEIWPDAMTSGKELPSVAVNRYSALAMYQLMLIVTFAVLWYLCLVFSGAQSMGNQVMINVWQAGLPLMLCFFFGIIAAMICWALSMNRIMQIMLPKYPVKGINFLHYTLAKDEVSLGRYFAAWGLEFTFINGVIILTLIFVGQIWFTFTAEWKEVRRRPRTPHEFICWSLSDLQKYQMKNQNQQDLILKTIGIFEKAGINLNARGVEMDHFIGMWPHLQFDHGDLADINTLHVAALHAAYHDLYGALDL